MLSENSMHTSKKFAFDVGITLLASVITLPLGFIITVLLGRYLGAGDLGLYRMAYDLRNCNACCWDWDSSGDDKIRG